LNGRARTQHINKIAARARNKQILDINSVSMSSRGKEQKERSGDGDFAAVRS